MRFAWVGSLFFSLAAQAHNPYSQIELGRLSNGARYVLAPSTDARTVQIKVIYNVGHFSEAPGKAGVAHLLEHAVFLDEKLGSQMTYMDLIREKGGVGNAFTNRRFTGYHATLSPSWAEWGVEIFGRMLIGKKFSERLVQKEKSVVFQEIGRPELPDFLVSAVATSIQGRQTAHDDFRNTELGLREPSYDREVERVQTRDLRATDLQAFYSKYYHANNVTILIAGKFDRDQMREKVKSTFSRMPGGLARGYEDATPVARQLPYVRSESAGGSSKIQLGFKVAGLNYEEELTARIYFEDLADRLQMLIRNQKGESYSVQTCPDLVKGFGQITVCLDTPRESFRENKAIVEKYLRAEILEGQITEAQFRNAHKRLGDTYRLAGTDALAQMRLAEELIAIERHYPLQSRTPFEVYAELDFDRYRATLAKIFRADMSFSKTTAPPLFFRFELALFCMLTYQCALGLARRRLARKFDHQSLRSVRRLAVGPPLMLELGVISAAFMFCLTLALFLEPIWIRSNLVGKHFVVAEYLPALFFVGVFLYSVQWGFSFFGKKILLCTDRLYIKSPGYFSYELAYTDIESVELLSEFAVWKSWRRLRSLGWRHFHYGNPWVLGLYIEMKNGRSFFIGTKKPREALKELKVLMDAHKAQPLMLVPELPDTKQAA